MIVVSDAGSSWLSCIKVNVFISLWWSNYGNYQEDLPTFSLTMVLQAELLIYFNLKLMVVWYVIGNSHPSGKKTT